MDNNRETVRFDDMQWIQPVEKVSDLPATEIREGVLCYVQAADAVYTLRQGVWEKGADIRSDP